MNSTIRSLAFGLTPAVMLIVGCGPTPPAFFRPNMF